MLSYLVAATERMLCLLIFGLAVAGVTALQQPHERYERHQYQQQPAVLASNNRHLDQKTQAISLALSQTRAPLILPANNEAASNNYNIHPLNTANWPQESPQSPKTASQDYKQLAHGGGSLANKHIQQLEASQSNSLANNIELALRQASGDESVFQPAPAFGTPGGGHGLDWFMQSNSPFLTTQQQAPSQTKETVHSSTITNSNQLVSPASFEQQQQQQQQQHNSFSSSTRAATTSTTTTSTSTYSPLNPIADQSNSISFGPQRTTSTLFGNQSLSQAGGAFSTNTDLSNQLVYEATAAPSDGGGTGNYFFMSPHKVSNVGERSSNVWW